MEYNEKVEGMVKLTADILLKSHSPCLQKFWCYSLNVDLLFQKSSNWQEMSQNNNWPHGGAMAL